MNSPGKKQLSRETFVLRLWTEDAVSLVWRGEVQHVRSGRMVAIQSLEDLLDCLHSQLDEQADIVTDERGGLR